LAGGQVAVFRSIPLGSDDAAAALADLLVGAEPSPSGTGHPAVTV